MKCGSKLLWWYPWFDETIPPTDSRTHTHTWTDIYLEFWSFKSIWIWFHRICQMDERDSVSGQADTQFRPHPFRFHFTIFKARHILIEELCSQSIPGYSHFMDNGKLVTFVGKWWNLHQSIKLRLKFLWNNLEIFFWLD